ncbi:MAG: sigma-70 family RNA polymerase sigma factor [Acidimicrobiales bacterium]
MAKADDDDRVRRYLEAAATDELLDHREERQLVERLAAGDAAARTELIDRHRRLVVAIAKRYRASGVSLGDLVENGHAGLVMAASEFRTDKGFAFTPYATWWIRRAVVTAISRKGRAVGAPVDAPTALLDRIQHAWDDFFVFHHRQPSLTELADEVGLPEAEVHAALATPDLGDIDNL